MASRLTLILPPAFGSKKVQVDSKRFSIGRTPENDLVLEDTSLSRRHALIEDYDGVFNLSDCGSSNGTLINGREVNGVIELHDGDVLTFGGVGDVVVHLENNAERNPQSKALDRPTSPPTQYLGASPQTAANASSSTDGSAWFSPPVIAISAAVLILLVAGLVLVLTQAGGNSRRTSRTGISRKQVTPIENSDNVASRDTPASTESTSPPNINESTAENSGNPDPSDLSVVEAAASKVLSGISKDTHPVLTEKPLKEIDSQIQRYRSSPSALRDQLRAMKRDIGAVSALAKSNGLRPPLLVYAALAEMDRSGGRGEPASVAGQICPELARMSKIFGDELANDSVLAVAALQEGASLQARITKLASRVNDSPTTIRSIWYLHEHQAISDSTYAFVLRFIAIGAIAQNPPAFGISAEPLTF